MDVRVLGSLEVYGDDGSLLAIGSGQQRAFLALLIVRRGEVVTMEQAVDAIWGASPPASAANSIHVYVSHLRKALGEDRVLTRGRGYAIAIEPGELDAELFEAEISEGRRRLAQGDADGASEALTSALGLCRGRPYDDLFYEDFAQAEIGRLQELRLTALEDRLAADVERGQEAAAVPELETLVREHPFRERFRGQLMLALYRSGRQAEALEVYREGRDVLVEELGLEPDPSLQELERRILRQDPSLLVQPAAHRAPDAEVTRRRRGLVLLIAGAALLVTAGGAALARQLWASEPAVTVPANSVAHVDPDSSRVVADVATGDGPVAIAVGEGAVWVANGGDQTISRVDPRSLQVATIGVGGDVSDAAVGFGSVWVATGNDGSLVRLDAETRGRVATLTFGQADALVPAPVFSVATGAGGVWLTRGNRLLRVDPATNVVSLSVEIEPPLGLAVGGGSVWVTTRTAHVLRFDPATETVRANFSLPAAAVQPAYGGGALWVVLTSLGDAIWTVDPDTGEPTATAGAGARDIAWGLGSLWSASQGALFQLDPSGTVLARTPLGQNAAAVGVLADGVWVAVRDEVR